MEPEPSAAPSGNNRAIFVFPSAAGHVNPSLPLARGLVARGWAVDYLAIPQFKEAIEDTGAAFWDRDGVCATRASRTSPQWFWRPQKTTATRRPSGG